MCAPSRLLPRPSKPTVGAPLIDLSVPIGLTFQFADHSFAMLLTGPKSIDQSRVGHGSVQTTERYLGCTQRIVSAVNDRIGIEPKREASGPEQWPTSRSNIDRRKGFVGTDLLNSEKLTAGANTRDSPSDPAINYKCDFRHSPRRVQSL